MGVRETVAQIMQETDEKVTLAAGADLASLQVRWSELSLDDRVAVVYLLLMGNNRALWAIVDRLEPPAPAE